MSRNEQAKEPITPEGPGGGAGGVPGGGTVAGDRPAAGGLADAGRLEGHGDVAGPAGADAHSRAVPSEEAAAVEAGIVAYTQARETGARQAEPSAADAPTQEFIGVSAQQAGGGRPGEADSRAHEVSSERADEAGASARDNRGAFAQEATSAPGGEAGGLTSEADSTSSQEDSPPQEASAGAGKGVRLVLATGNQHKIGELRAILAPLVGGLGEEEIAGANAFNVPEPVEDEVTFAGNALIKARHMAQATGLVALADDSGLAVDVLGGCPGVFSARWSGQHGSDKQNLELLLSQLADVPDRYRAAAFVCAAAMVTPDGREYVRIGEMRGRLLREPRGTNGFGYDPIFCADGYEVSNAELAPEVKDAISHRGKAFRELAPLIRRELGLD